MFNNEKNTTPSVYFKSLEIENVRCFKEKQTIDFTDKNGDIAQWTVILGNNNTGKTTLLRCLADFEIQETIINDPLNNRKEVLYSSDFSWIDDEIWDACSAFEVKTILVVNENDEKELYYKSFKMSEEADDNNPDNWLGEESYLSKKDGFSLFHYSNFIIYDVLRIPDGITDFIDDNRLINSEEWLIRTDYAAKNGAIKAINRLKNIKQVLIKILPDIQDFKFVTNEETLKSHVEVKSDFGWTRINDLGYGYQTLMAWVVDLAKRMFDRYPNSEKPLEEPAIVLVDEIDLHLHPEWQRKIIQWLTDFFPRTQFIVTAHSPLVVQSAENINVVLLKKEEERGAVKIEQPDITNFQGWTVEEILSELMGLDNRIHSDAYLAARRDFDNALDEDNYLKAKSAYDALDKILHPNSPQRKLMRLQMASLTPLEPSLA